MLNIPLNIFFYWDKDIPNEVTNNVNNYKRNNLNYNVTILNDNSINKYKNDFPVLISLFHLVTIPALKADIIRMIFLFEEGGMWLDSNTTLINNNGIKILFDKCKKFDFVITVLPESRCDLKTSALISKPKSKLAFDTIRKMTENLLKHYQIEKTTVGYVPYNFFMFVAPVVFCDLLEYKFDYKFRKSIFQTILYKKQYIVDLDLPKFKEYNCALMIVDKYIKFYGCNMKHHHEKNMSKHWSEVQKHQRLFKSKNDLEKKRQETLYSIRQNIRINNINNINNQKYSLVNNTPKYSLSMFKYKH
jgi:hypothetical protein